MLSLQVISVFDAADKGIDLMCVPVEEQLHLWKRRNTRREMKRMIMKEQSFLVDSRILLVDSRIALWIEDVEGFLV